MIQMHTQMHTHTHISIHCILIFSPPSLIVYRKLLPKHSLKNWIIVFFSLGYLSEAVPMAAGLMWLGCGSLAEPVGTTHSLLLS